MITNNQIQQAFFTALSAAALGYPIAYPGRNFTPPDDGYWLVADIFPGNGIQNGISNSAQVVQGGLIQVSVYCRPNIGIIGLTTVADSVVDAFPKGTVLVDPVRVSRTPYHAARLDLDDRIQIPVTIPYSA